jgi:hypothetical protein
MNNVGILRSKRVDFLMGGREKDESCSSWQNPQIKQWLSVNNQRILKRVCSCVYVTVSYFSISNSESKFLAIILQYKDSVSRDEYFLEGRS